MIALLASLKWDDVLTSATAVGTVSAAVAAFLAARAARDAAQAGAMEAATATRALQMQIRPLLVSASGPVVVVGDKPPESNDRGTGPPSSVMCTVENVGSGIAVIQGYGVREHLMFAGKLGRSDILNLADDERSFHVGAGKTQIFRLRLPQGKMQFMHEAMAAKQPFVFFVDYSDLDGNQGTSSRFLCSWRSGTWRTTDQRHVARADQRVET